MFIETTVNNLHSNTEAKTEGKSCLRGFGIFGEEDAFSFLKICLNKVHQVLGERTADNTLLIYPPHTLWRRSTK